MSSYIRPIKHIKIFIAIGVVLSLSLKILEGILEHKKKKKKKTTKSIKFKKEK
jgi:hypothetical protein